MFQKLFNKSDVTKGAAAAAPIKKVDVNVGNEAVGVKEPVTPTKSRPTASNLDAQLSPALNAAALESPRLKMNPGLIQSGEPHTANTIFKDLSKRLMDLCLTHLTENAANMSQLEQQALRLMKEYAALDIAPLSRSTNDESGKYDQMVVSILSKAPKTADKVSVRVVTGTDAFGKPTKSEETITEPALKLPFALVIETFVADEQRKRASVVNSQLVAHKQSVEEAVAAAVAAERQATKEALMPYMGLLLEAMKQKGMPMTQFQPLLSITNSSLKEVTEIQVETLLSKVGSWDANEAKYILSTFLTPLRNKLVLILANICQKAAIDGDFQGVIAKKLIFDLCSDPRNDATVGKIFESTMQMLAEKMNMSTDKIWTQFKLFNEKRPQLISENDQRPDSIIRTHSESRAWMKLFKDGCANFLLQDVTAYNYWHCQVFPQGSADRHPKIKETTIVDYHKNFSEKITQWLCQQAQAHATSARSTPAVGGRLAP